MNLKKFLYRIGHWETWHYLAKYIPLFPAWLWYCLRSGSMWFFTPSNPTLAFGGFEGESKKEMYDQLPPGSFPQSIYIKPTLSFAEANQLRASAGFTYPFAVKPDVGMMGFMFRMIRDESQFKHYHSVMPVEYIVQELVTYPLEVSVFYYRYPNQQTGTITGFLKKEFLMWIVPHLLFSRKKRIQSGMKKVQFDRTLKIGTDIISITKSKQNSTRSYRSYIRKILGSPCSLEMSITNYESGMMHMRSSVSCRN